MKKLEDLLEKAKADPTFAATLKNAALAAKDKNGDSPEFRSLLQHFATTPRELNSLVAKATFKVGAGRRRAADSTTITTVTTTTTISCTTTTTTTTTSNVCVIAAPGAVHNPVEVHVNKVIKIAPNFR